jgi:pimeloyl-ACP methyl ester carboxylesterase/DNA-binding winged helix-turn-helix (wHTH) protein
MQAENKTNQLEIAEFVFDFERAELRSRSGDRVSLRPQVFAVLQCLAQRPGFLVGKKELMRCVWPKVVVCDDSLVQCIIELRSALHDDLHRIVQTEPRRGYRLVCAGASAGAAAPSGVEGTETAPAFVQDIRFVTTEDSVRLAYAASGAGAPLLRCAHWMTHLDWDWRSATLGPQIQALSQQHRLLRYDGRGYGLSDWDSAPGPFEQSVDDLRSVADAAGLDRFALYGASTGAPAAIRFAARHPERVTQLVLLGGYARGVLRRGAASTSPDNFQALLRLIEDGWSRDNPAFRQLLTSLHWPGANAQQMESFNHLQRVSCTPQTAVALIRRDAECDVTQDLPEVRCPTLVLHSPRDARVPFEEGRLVASAIGGARLEPFDSANHLPLLGEPAFAQVQQRIAEFLLERGQRSRPSSQHAALNGVDRPDPWVVGANPRP